MLKKKHREYDMRENEWLIVAKSREQMYKELNQFVRENAADDNTIWFFEQNVRPSKENLRPEYAMEVLIKSIKDTSVCMFYRRIH